MLNLTIIREVALPPNTSHSPRRTRTLHKRLRTRVLSLLLIQLPIGMDNHCECLNYPTLKQSAQSSNFELSTAGEQK